jgi:Uma2 family endonuclease
LARPRLAEPRLGQGRIHEWTLTVRATGLSVDDVDRTSVPTKRWARVEYERLVDLAVFPPGDRIELVGGQLVVREPQGSPHAVAAGLAEDTLRAAFGSAWVVRVQMPVALDDESEPEPDVAVCAGSPRDYLAGHPTRPVLVVEVAESSLVFDREHKGSLYARAQVSDYWIVNLVDRVLEVYRDPTSSADASYGWRFNTLLRLGAADVVTPLAAPEARIPIADLLP